MRNFNIICKLLIGILLGMCMGCGDSHRLKDALQAAGNNRQALEAVLNHYPAGSDKRKALKFLIENMPWHHSPDGKAIEIFRDSVLKKNKKESLEKLWQNILLQYPMWRTPQADIQKVDTGDLIRDIDFAFATWEKAPWKDSIPFDIFKEYVLPYTVDNEPLTDWRKPLHDKYAPLIEGINSPREAFDKLYTHIIKKFRLQQASEYSYITDPVIVAATMRGSCNVRTMYIVCAARALCIPAAFDYVNYWSNYTSMGHSWAAYIDAEGEPWVLSEHDKSSHKKGPIDASLFPAIMDFDPSTLPYTVDSLKRTAKIMRRTFSADPRFTECADKECPDYLSRPDYRDVSRTYGLTGKMEIKTEQSHEGQVYLCSFVTGRNWTPMGTTKQSGKRVIFENIAEGNVYLPAKIADGEIIPLSNPVIIETGGKQRKLDPLPDFRDTVKLYRKYIMTTYWLPNRWGKNIGVTFEGSDDPDFREKDTLHLITQMPEGLTSVEVNARKAYRYVRINPPHRVRLKISEAAFYGLDKEGKEQELTGKLIYRHLPEENAARLFDKNYLTEITARTNYYWAGYDFGKGNKIKVSRLTWCPWNDGNMVEPGNLYELFYYDMGWHSLGKQRAKREFLVYNNVPRNALLWLRDLSKGKEERVFTWENDKQVWW